ncbi:MAG: hypothetical protein SGI92_01140 [Bryobacteraceae bacterium]|nr:hypothetical protein [Bryobacteraceae bacterium]
MVPGRMEFAAAIRHALLREQPKVVAVELPLSLGRAWRKAVRRLPEISVILYPGESEDDLVYVPVEPADPFTEAVRSALELGAEVAFIEPDLTMRPHLQEPAPDSYALHATGYDRYVAMYREARRPRSKEIEAHARAIAWKLQGTNPFVPTAVVISLILLDAVIAALNEPQEDPDTGTPRRDIEMINPHPDCLGEILIEYPFLQSRYEDHRMLLDDVDSIRRPHVQLDVLRHAETTYESNTGEKIVHWHRRLMAKYTRNLAAANGDLTCSIFDMCVAARSIVDDNYGWEVWESANRYPAQKVQSDLETVSLSADTVYRNSKHMRLRRRLPRFKQQVRPSSLKKRKKEAYQGEWAQQLNGTSICSYPPEDLVIETYGKFLKQKAKSLLSEERSRVEPFTTSMLDGIDLRETIRNWHDGRLRVRNSERISGEVGSVIVIFDEDRTGDKYPYLTTWLGEHQNESDMAFYSTFPFSHIVGPGIGRAEYGGFLMTLPPRRLYDVWADPDYDFTENKAERLLMAGLDYSVERMVVYVASKPPRSIFRSMAARMGHQILYIPLGQLSPAKLKKVRVVHVLDGYDKRDQAKDYLW